MHAYHVADCLHIHFVSLLTSLMDVQCLNIYKTDKLLYMAAYHTAVVSHSQIFFPFLFVVAEKGLGTLL